MSQSSQNDPTTCTPLNVIQDVDITWEHIKRCKENGLTSLELFVRQDALSISTLTGLPKPVIDKMMERAYAKMPPVFFMTALELHREHLSNLSISTGSKQMDLLLGGKGIESGVITEFIGGSGMGKSQLCMTLSVTCQLPKINSCEGPTCMFIDAGSNFYTTRVVDIARRFNLNPDLVLENIKHLSLQNTELLPRVIELIRGELEKHINYTLVVIDSATWLFRMKYIGTNMKDRNQEMINNLIPLKEIAQQYRVAVVLTNSTYVVFQTQQVVPYGDNVLNNISTHRVMLRPLPNGIREARIISSPSLQVGGTCAFGIDRGGVH